jgi:hypothetical protein
MKPPYSLISTVAISAMILVAGCDRQTQDTPPAPAKPASATADDLAAATEIVQGEKQAAPATNSSELPPGHPPIDGGTAQPAQPDQPALPPGHPPTGDSSSKPPMPQIKAGVAPSGKELQYDVPTGWKSETPDMSMRKAQFVLPAPEEGAGDGQLLVYYFGAGEGGPVRQNLDRWRGMFTDDDGQPVSGDAVKEETIEANGLKVTTLDVAGHYNNSMMPGASGGMMSAAPAKSNQRMLAAIIETDEGPWFFKAVGPAETMAAQKENFDAFVRSVKY